MDQLNDASRVLIIEDDPDNGIFTQRVLQSAGFLCDLAVSAEQGLDFLAKSCTMGPDVILLGENLEGIRVGSRGRIESPNYRYTPVIILTAHDSLQARIQRLNRGEDNYFAKPHELIALVSAMLKIRKLDQPLKDDEQVNWNLTGTLDLIEKLSNSLGRSPQMRRICELIIDIATSDTHVLIQGESGTGKEVVARTIHENSLRKQGPFVAINCAAYSETLLLSELFGHEKGAFAGAAQRKPGRFEQADGGTIFLDEIGEISLPSQITLSRVIRDQKFEPLGSTRTVKVNIRIITASNRMLKDEVKKGAFREDLFYRLSVVPILVPALRERKEDIPLLIEHFLKIYNEKNGRNLQGFHPRALDALMRYSWPGNIRELENVVERAVILTRDDYVQLSEVPVPIRQVK